MANQKKNLNKDRQRFGDIAAGQWVDLMLSQVRYQRDNTDPKKLNKSKNQYETKRTN